MSKKVSEVNLNSLLTTLSLDNNNVKNVYLVGSRLWSTQRSDSDFDFIVVLADEKKQKNQPKKKGKNDNLPTIPKQTSKGQYDVTFYGESEWKTELNEFHFLNLLCSFLPEANIFKLQTNYLPETLRIIKDNSENFVNRILQIIERDKRVAEKDFIKGFDARSKKRILHTIRTILLSKDMLQVAHKKKELPLDFEIAAEFNYDLLYVNISDGDYQAAWETFRDKYFPVIDQFIEQLNESLQEILEELKQK